jgi:ribosome-binding protein aMBF1 (putative translation factor)
MQFYGINLPWSILQQMATLPWMSTKQKIQHLKGGRPVGAKSTDPVIARAFGQAVVALRTAQGVSQEALALKAQVDRSYLGRLERGQNVPNLVGVTKLAAALGCSATALVSQFENEISALKDAGANP